MKISLIVACDQNKGIGINNHLPWKLPSDMKFFRDKTTNHCVLMGRKTFDSMGQKKLPNRTNIIISRDKKLVTPEETFKFNSILEGIMFAKDIKEEELFVIGGSEIYKLVAPYADNLYITEVDGQFEVDTYLDIKMDNFNEVERITKEVDEKNLFKHHFIKYENKGNKISDLW